MVAPPLRPTLLFFLAAALAAAACGGAARSPTLLTLHRAFPLNEKVEIEVIRARDRARHARILRGVGGVVDFSVAGTSDPYLVGLYFTRVKLGTPPREYNVQIDTGSDILWVTCNTCSDCPKTSGLGIDLNFYDTSGSSTAASVSCSDPMCNSIGQITSSMCSSQTNQCSYSFQYGDGSGTSGFYVSDVLYFDMIFGDAMVANSSASVIFGCSTYQSGDLTKSDRAVDGIFGFGQQHLSVISQLASRGLTPKVFSHCLKGDSGGGGNGGGVLVLGEILDPNVVYSPLVPSQPHYNLNLESIAVNGQSLPIDPSVFATSNNRGTIVDSGTTLAYLVEEAYDPFVSAVTNSILQTVRPVVSKGNQCYLTPMSISDVFPTASLNFAGGASMVLKPEEYLVHMGFVDGAAMWCMGFQKVQGQGVTILGAIDYQSFQFHWWILPIESTGSKSCYGTVIASRLLQWTIGISCKKHKWGILPIILGYKAHSGTGKTPHTVTLFCINGETHIRTAFKYKGHRSYEGLKYPPMWVSPLMLHSGRFSIAITRLVKCIDKDVNIKLKKCNFRSFNNAGCMCWQDLVLKDKIFIYDLDRQRIGWANYDCSSSVNVSITLGREESINAGQLSQSSSPEGAIFRPISVSGLLLTLITSQVLLHFISAF